MTRRTEDGAAKWALCALRCEMETTAAAESQACRVRRTGRQEGAGRRDRQHGVLGFASTRCAPAESTILARRPPSSARAPLQPCPMRKRRSRHCKRRRSPHFQARDQPAPFRPRVRRPAPPAVAPRSRPRRSPFSLVRAYSAQQRAQAAMAEPAARAAVGRAGGRRAASSPVGDAPTLDGSTHHRRPFLRICRGISQHL